VVNQVLSGERPNFTSQTPAAVRELVVACWSKEPKKRPSAAKVAFILTNRSTRHQTVAVDATMVAEHWSRKRSAGAHINSNR